MQIHTTVFYCLVAVLAILYYAVNKIFNMKADIIVFYYVITAVLVIAYGLYVKFKNAGETKKIKAMFVVCAVVVVADVAACVHYLPKYTYKQAETIVNEQYGEGKTKIDVDTGNYFVIDGQKFCKGAYVFYYDNGGDAEVYVFNQYTGESVLAKTVKNYNADTVAEEIIKGE